MPQDNQLIRESLRLTQEYCEMQMANSTHGPEAILRSINPEIENGQRLFYYSTTSKWSLAQWLQDPYDDKNKTLIAKVFDYQMNFKRGRKQFKPTGNPDRRKDTRIYD